MEQIKLGIIGVGNMGTTHVQNILAGKCPEIALAAVADRREARRQWAQGTVPETVQIFEEGSDLIKSGLCEAVLIAVDVYKRQVFERDEKVLDQMELDASLKKHLEEHIRRCV